MSVQRSSHAREAALPRCVALLRAVRVDRRRASCWSRPHRAGLATFGATVYAITLVGMFGASALYHRGNWSPPTARAAAAARPHRDLPADRRYLHADRAARDGRHRARVAAARAVWMIAVAGIIFEWMPMPAPRGYVTTVYIVPRVDRRVRDRPAVRERPGWRGVAAHRRGWPLLHGRRDRARGEADPIRGRETFGYHEIFHVFVIARRAAALLRDRVPRAPARRMTGSASTTTTSATTASSGTPTPTTTRPSTATRLDGDPRAWGVWRIPEAEVGVLGRRRTGSTCSSTAAAPPSGRSQLAADGARVVGARPVARRSSVTRERSVVATGAASPSCARAARRVPLRRRVVRRRVLRPRRDVVLRSRRSRSPEVARLLRPGGRLVFSHTTPWPLPRVERASASASGRRLRRPYFGMRRFDDARRGHRRLPDRPTASGSGRSVGTASSSTTWSSSAPRSTPPPPASDFDPRWARRWPAEQIWSVRKE